MEIITLDSSLTSTKPSYSRFAGIQQKIISSPDSNILVDINIDTRLGLSFLFCISTLPLLAQSCEKSIQIFCNKKSQQLFANVRIRVPSGEKETIDEHAESMGESTNTFVRRAIAETMSRDKKKIADQK